MSDSDAGTFSLVGANTGSYDITERFRTVKTFVVASAALAVSATLTAQGATTALQTPAPAVERAEVSMSATGKRPSIPVRLHDGRSMEVTYDTGSQGAIVTKSIAEQLKLEVVGETMVGSPAGGTPIPAKIVSLGRLSVGGYPAKVVDAVVLDDSALPPGSTITIGNNQFPDARIELDFANSKFRLEKSTQSATATWMPLSDRGLTLGAIRIAGVEIPLYVDSGNPGWLDLPKSFAERLPLKGPLVDAPPMRLVDDRVIPRFAAPMDTVGRIGETELTLRGNFTFADVRFANLGAAALKHAKIVIDMPSKKWMLGYENIPVIAPTSVG